MGVSFAGFTEIDLQRHARPTRSTSSSPRARTKRMTYELHSDYFSGHPARARSANRFNYGVGRWITIKGLDAKPALALTPRLALCRYPTTACAADFECSNRLLNDIYRHDALDIENLKLGGYVVDCPHRERMGYGGDAHATTETALVQLPFGAFYTKWAQDWATCKAMPRPGASASRRAKAVRAGQPRREICPTRRPPIGAAADRLWSAAIARPCPGSVYRQYGDGRILRAEFPDHPTWSAFLESKSADDMLVAGAASGIFWAIGSARRRGNQRRHLPKPVPQQLLLDLQPANGGRNCRGDRPAEAAAKYRQRARSRTPAQSTPGSSARKENSYVDGFAGRSLHFRCWSIFRTEELRPANVWQRLEDEILDAAVATSTRASPAVTSSSRIWSRTGATTLSVLAMAGKDNYPSWGYMLRQGALHSGNRGKATLRSCTVPSEPGPVVRGRAVEFSPTPSMADSNPS